MSRLIVAEKGVLKPKNRKELKAAGFIVLEVDNINTVKFTETESLPPPIQEQPAQDGFNLD